MDPLSRVKSLVSVKYLIVDIVYSTKILVEMLFNEETALKVARNWN